MAARSGGPRLAGPPCADGPPIVASAFQNLRHKSRRTPTQSRRSMSNPPALDAPLHGDENPATVRSESMRWFPGRRWARPNLDEPEHAESQRAPIMGEDMRQRLLGEPAEEDAVLGDCTVTLQAVGEMVLRERAVRNPVIVVSLEVADRRVDTKPGPKTQVIAPDFARFPLLSVSSNICILCYEGTAERGLPLGRIILPVVDLFWPTGEALTTNHVRSLVRPVASLSRRYTAKFLPLGDGRFDDHFRPAWTGVAGSGMNKSGVFGSVDISVDISLEAHAMTPFHVQRKMVMTGLNSVKESIVSARAEHAQVLAHGQPLAEEEGPEPSLMSVLRDLDIRKTERYANRIKWLLQSCIKGRSRGFIRWLRHRPMNGVISGVVWYVFCAMGFFPPPAWAWPLYIWLAFLGNGLVASVQREHDWADLSVPAFDVWNEEMGPEVKPSTREMLSKFKKAVKEVEGLLQTVVVALERFINSLVFVDAPASVFIFAWSGLVSSCLSFVWFLASCHDPSGNWTFGIVGGLLLVLAALNREKKDSWLRRRMQKEPLLPLVWFNSVFGFVPDQSEVAHRYITTHIQCARTHGVLRITIFSASGLAAQDTRLFAENASDPYCICQVPGRSKLRITTPVVYRCLSPQWNYTAEIVDYTQGDSLAFSVWDKDKLSRDDLLGKVTLKSLEFFPQGYSGDLQLTECPVPDVDSSIRVKIEVLLAE